MEEDTTKINPDSCNLFSAEEYKALCYARINRCDLSNGEWKAECEYGVQKLQEK